MDSKMLAVNAWGCTVLCCFAAGASAQSREDTLRSEAVAGMRKAATFYQDQVASHGGYVYYYALDLRRRWGEGEATRDQIFVQPPGTPTVGMAYLRAYEATGDRFYLDAATEAAQALIYGQLQSGGWTQAIDFDPRGSKVGQYRHGNGKGRNTSSLDDGQTQSAIQFLAQVDTAHGFKHKQIHEAAQVALDALLAAQFPNGAFPQVWTGPVPPQPILQANYPDYDWRTAGRIKNYWDMYTLNDGLAGSVAETLLEAHRIYEDSKYLTALARLGDFLLRAQMPEQQPAWAQQYNYQMQPIWARRFEPAAITGGESQDAMETLITIFRATGEEKYLAPIPAALAYLKRSRLSDGRLARYYELKTNRPLYMTRQGDQYSLTYNDSNLPDHYGWKVESRLAAIEKEYAALTSGAKSKLPNASPPSDLRQKAQRIVDDLDEQGRWVSTYSGERLVGQPRFPPNFQYLDSGLFSRNMELLCRFVKNSP